VPGRRRELDLILTCGLTSGIVYSATQKQCGEEDGDEV
jgi:hypothetical protein